MDGHRGDLDRAAPAEVAIEQAVSSAASTPGLSIASATAAVRHAAAEALEKATAENDIAPATTAAPPVMHTAGLVETDGTITAVTVAAATAAAMESADALGGDTEKTASAVALSVLAVETRGREERVGVQVSRSYPVVICWAKSGERRMALH